MAKYHVGKDGQAKPCKAASADSCPLAKADDSGVVKHFDSLDAAQSYGERVAMGLVGEDSSHEAPVAGMRDDGHYVDDSGHVYPKMGQEWSDDDRAAYVAQAARDVVEAGAYDPDDSTTDDLKSIAAGEWDWDDIQRERRAPTGYGQSPLFEGESVMLGSQWDALDSKYPVITDDGGIREAKDSERPATDDEISEYVRSSNADALRNDVSIVSSFDGLDGYWRFDDAPDEEKALIRESLDRADAAVASGDFEAAADEYQTAAEHLGYDHGTASFHQSDPVLEQLKDRWDMASAAACEDGLSMSDLPNDPYYEEERQLEPGTFALDGGVIPFDLDDDDDDDEDGIRR